jgi:hypothetical protein
MEGYLKLKVNLLTGFNKYYFILFRENLIYCEEKGGKKLGSFNLTISKIETNP